MANVNYRIFLLKRDLEDGNIISNTYVTDYSSLPAASLHNDEIFIVENSQGLEWEGVSNLYYSKGFYYSDGLEWTFAGLYPFSVGGGPGIIDGDKGDITVSAGGATWTINAASVDLSKLSALGVPTASNFLRGDNTWADPTVTLTMSYAEIPSGIVNSINLVFTLANTPVSGNNVIVLLNGVTQYNGIDYNVLGSTITFTTAPITGSSIFAYYNTAATSSGGDYNSLVNVPFTFPPSVHNHDDRYYTETETDALLNGKANNLGPDDNYVTGAEKVVIGNTSGTNTGDQDLSGKQDVLINQTNIKSINGNSILGSGDLLISTYANIDGGNSVSIYTGLINIDGGNS